MQHLYPATPARRTGAYPPDFLPLQSRAAGRRAAAEIATWPGFAVTSLHDLKGLAATAGLGAVYYKDESSRFGLGSFKALGGAYAVLRQIGRASCRERVCLRVDLGGRRIIKKKKTTQPNPTYRHTHEPRTTHTTLPKK